MTKLLNVLQELKNKTTFSEENRGLINAFDEAIAEVKNSKSITEADVLAIFNKQAEGAISREDLLTLENSLNEKMKQFENKAGVEKDYLHSDQHKRDLLSIINKAQSEEQFGEMYNAKLIENGITDTTGALKTEAILYGIVDKFYTPSGLLALLNNTGLKCLKVAVNGADPTATTSRASKHTAGQDKTSQSFTMTKKEISAEIIYKLQSLDRETILQSDGAVVINYVLAELLKQISNELEMAILVGDGRSAGNTKITKFEAIARATTDDYVTVFTGAAAQTVPTMDNIKAMVDSIDADGDIHVYMTSTSITALQKYVAATGGTTSYKPLDVLASELGVAGIHKSKFLSNTLSGYGAVAFVPSAYATVGDMTPETIRQFYLRKNQDDFLMEVYAGGGLTQLKAGAVLKYAAA